MGKFILLVSLALFFLRASFLMAAPTPAPGIDAPRIYKAIRNMDNSIKKLRGKVKPYGIRAPVVYDRYSTEKIFPQVGFDVSIVVVGGPTQAGKSTVSNVIWGGHEPIATVIHTAGGTKYPVVGVHELAGEEAVIEGLLSTLFPGFTVKRRSSLTDSITAADANYLYYSFAPGKHRDRLLIDLPDHDSDREENGEVAYACGRIADIVVAVTTDQKYRDAVSIEYFAELARAGKPMVLLINKIDVEYDRKNVKDWVKEWKTSINKALKRKGDKTTRIEHLLQAVYIGQNDKAAVAHGRSPAIYYMGRDGLDAPVEVDLGEHLNHLDFGKLRRESRLDAIKLAMTALDGGAISYLNEIERRAQEFFQITEDLKKVHDVSSAEYPLIPDEMFVRAISNWWAQSNHRDVVTKTAIGIFNSVSNAAAAVARFAGYRSVGENNQQVIQQEADLIRRVISATLHHLKNKIPQGVLTEEEEENLFDPNKVTEIQDAALLALQGRRDLESALQDHLLPGLVQWSKDYPKELAAMRLDDFLQNVAPPAVSVALGTLALTATHMVPGAPLVFKALGTQGGALAQLGEWLLVAGGTKPHAVGAAESVVASRFRRRFNELYVSFIEARMLEVAEWLRNFPLKSVLTKIHEGSALTRHPDYVASRTCADEIMGYFK